MYSVAFSQYFLDCQSKAKKTGKRAKSQSQKNMLPAAPFRLSSADLTLADKRALNVRVPVGYGWKPCAFFCKRPYLKSHDWQQVNVRVCVSSSSSQSRSHATSVCKI